MQYLHTYRPMQLRFSSAMTVVDDAFEVRNFGESKGLSFDRVLIYPTKDMMDWLYKPEKELADATRAKTYVAITRARFSVAFVMDPKKGKVPSGIAQWSPASVPSAAYVHTASSET